MKIRLVKGGGQIFWCPGCDSAHQVNTSPKSNWTWNGDMDRPTFSPSILVTCEWHTEDDTMKDDRCHSFVKDGQIQFLSDCTHAKAGQTVDIPEWPHAPGTFGGVIDP